MVYLTPSPSCILDASDWRVEGGSSFRKRKKKEKIKTTFFRKKNHSPPCHSFPCKKKKNKKTTGTVWDNSYTLNCKLCDLARSPPCHSFFVVPHLWRQDNQQGLPGSFGALSTQNRKRTKSEKDRNMFCDLGSSLGRTWSHRKAVCAPWCDRWACVLMCRRWAPLLYALWRRCSANRVEVSSNLCNQNWSLYYKLKLRSEKKLFYFCSLEKVKNDC